MPRNQIDKQPAETFIVGVDFASRLATGENLVLEGSSCAEECTTHPSSDAPDVVILANSLDVSGSSSLILRVSGGIATHRYKLSFRGATSFGNIYEHDITIKMID